MAVIHLDAGANRKSAAAVYDLRRRPVEKAANGDILSVALNHATDRRTLAGGMELFAEGEVSDSLYVVLDGWLNLYRILEDGRRQILDFALPGAVLGYRASADAIFPFSAEALTPATVAVIPLARVDVLLREGSAAGRTLLSAMNEALIGAFDSMTDIGRRTAREAVAHFMLRMDRRIRKVSPCRTDDAVPFPLTQEHIGDALGLTAVHVCRTLRTLRADGLLAAGGGRLRIDDEEALAEAAGVYPIEHKEPRLAS